MARLKPHARQLVTAFRTLDLELLKRRRQRLMVRLVWVAILIGTIGFVGRTWFGWSIGWAAIGAILGGIIVGGGIWVWRSRVNPTHLARVLDRSFHLDAQLGTALEMGYRGEETGFVPELIDQARRKVALIGPDVLARTAEPLRLEAQTLALVIFLALGIVLLGSTTRTLPLETAATLPTLPEATSDTQPPVNSPVEQPPDEQSGRAGGERPAEGTNGQESNTLDPESSAAAEAIAEALSDNGATRSAADALESGDTSEAAQELRDLAQQSSKLSPQSRESIAEALDDAANELQGTQPDRADQLRSSADQIREGGNETAQGLNDLAQTIDELGQAAQDNQQPAQGNQSGQPGQSGQPQDSGGSGSSTTPATGSRTSPPAAAQGQDVPLPPAPPDAGNTTSAPGGTSDTSITLPGGSGETSGGGSGGTGSVPSDLTDPAIIPPELRDAIQDYFDH